MANSLAPFDGTWYFSARRQAIIDDILAAAGWEPERNKATIYGTAIYLARCNWYGTHACDEIIACELDIQHHEGQIDFDGTFLEPALGIGNTARHVRGYLQGQKLIRGTNKFPGNHQNNLAIRDFFLANGIAAIHYEEYVSVPVVAVYDTRIIVNSRKILRASVPECAVPII
jgi:hypothetical protein